MKSLRLLTGLTLFLLMLVVYHADVSAAPLNLKDVKIYYDIPKDVKIKYYNQATIDPHDAVSHTDVLFGVYNEETGSESYDFKPDILYMYSNNSVIFVYTLQLPYGEHYRAVFRTTYGDSVQTDIKKFDVRPVEQIPETIMLTKPPQDENGIVQIDFNAVEGATSYRLYFNRFSFEPGINVSPGEKIWTNRLLRDSHDYLIIAYKDLKRIGRSGKFTINITEEYGYNIYDTQLDAAIRKKLNKFSGALSMKEMESITELSVPDQNISELFGIQQLVNLAKLDLSGNQIGELGDLVELDKLQELNVANNQITNFPSGINHWDPYPPSRRWPNIKKIYAQNNKLTSPLDFRYIRSLDTLYLSGNDIKDLHLFEHMVSVYINLIDKDFKIEPGVLLDEGEYGRFKRIPVYHVDGEIYIPLKMLGQVGFYPWEDAPGKYSIHQGYEGSKTLFMELGSKKYYLDGWGELPAGIIMHNNEVCAPLQYICELFGKSCGLEKDTGMVVIGYGWIKFPDKNLEAAVREEIGKPRGYITPLDINKLTSLNASSRGITDLTGIQCFPRLKTLHLENNQIKDISLLPSSLNELYLNNNLITDIKPLEKFKELTCLMLSRNMISDYTPVLPSYPNLISKDFSRIKMSGYISPDVVYAEGNTWSPLKGFKVEVDGTELSCETDNEGYFELISFAEKLEGTYSFTISKSNSLKRKIKDIPLAEHVQLGSKSSPISMWLGDLPEEGVQDEVINMWDILVLLISYNSCSGHPGYHAEHDLNQDNAVNMEDIIMLIKHFNKTSADYPGYNL
ncbi:MAG: leucine-rich repeat domain-containing protein [Clostridia bacterium]|nr:leucine-rich repeat domain-containing protein [Clostridia bacterium]